MANTIKTQTNQDSARSGLPIWTADGRQTVEDGFGSARFRRQIRRHSQFRWTCDDRKEGRALRGERNCEHDQQTEDEAKHGRPGKSELWAKISDLCTVQSRFTVCGRFVIILLYSVFGKPCPCAIFKKKIGWPDRRSRGLSPVGSTTEMGVDIGHAHLCTLQ